MSSDSDRSAEKITEQIMVILGHDLHCNGQIDSMVDSSSFYLITCILLRPVSMGSRRVILRGQAMLGSFAWRNRTVRSRRARLALFSPGTACQMMPAPNSKFCTHSMSTRKQRRAQAHGKTGEGDVPLSQPSKTLPNHKTLLDIANERQLLSKSDNSSPAITTTKIHPDGSLSTLEPNDDSLESVETPYLDIILYTITLALLHFTLTVLIHHQYATTPPSLPLLFYESTVVSPTSALLLILVALLHPRSHQIAIQLLFVTLSIVAGAWLVYASNEDPYMAVMKKAPPLGTLWVWAIVEMKWDWAVGCLGLVAGWAWWKGYTMY